MCQQTKLEAERTPVFKGRILYLSLIFNVHPSLQWSSCTQLHIQKYLIDIK